MSLSASGRRNLYFFGIRLVFSDRSNYFVQAGAVLYDPVRYNHLLGAFALNLLRNPRNEDQSHLWSKSRYG
ncbi:MAG TPA: hypothetical protein VN939_01390, partial [Chthoniobacterales bacterium]|nr:hypothetical protein [Chthoniobacterales bacterium]